MAIDLELNDLHGVALGGHSYPLYTGAVTNLWGSLVQQQGHVPPPPSNPRILPTVFDEASGKAASTAARDSASSLGRWESHFPAVQLLVSKSHISS